MLTPIRTRSVSAVLLAIAVGLAACSGSSGNEPEPAQTTETESTSTSATSESTDPSATTDTGAPVVSGPSRGGVLRVGLQEDPTPFEGWTPWNHICAWACRNVMNAVVETLAVRTVDGLAVPYLAESIVPADDLRSWTVVLRPGITFSDGTPLDADTVKAIHDEFLDTGTVTEGILREARIVSIDAVDDRVLRYELSGPFADLDVVLAGPVGRVFSVEAARTNPASFLRAPVGSGPFMFTGWTAGEPIELVRNPSYWRSAADGEDLPYLDGITFVQIGDEQERLGQLDSRDIDVLQTRAPRTIRQALDVGHRVIRRVEDNSSVLLFNMLEPPFDDQRVRRALALALDRQALIDAAGESDLAEPATQWWGPDSRWFSDRAAETSLSTDLPTAIQLLSEYANDPLRSDERPVGDVIDVPLFCTDDLRLQNMAREIERQWQATGLLAVEVNTIARGGLIGRVVGQVSDRPSFSGDFAVTCWRVGGESGPWSQLAPALGPVRTSPLNFANIEGEQFAELLSTLELAADTVTRKAIVEEIMVRLGDEVPYIHLAYTSSALVGHVDVGGLGLWSIPGGVEITDQIHGVGHYGELWLR